MSDEPSPSSSQLHRPHPLAQLRSSSRRQKTIPSRGDSDETPVSDNKNIQAAFDQLNQRSSTRSPALTESSSLSLSPGSEARSTAEGTTRTGIGTNPSLGSNNNNNNNNMSFTQRRLERGGAVPSSITSLDWNNHRYRGSVDQGLSSSSGSNEYDSSVYYGLSPFVTSSFVDTPLWERSPNGTGTSRYRSLRQRYEREKAEDLDEEVEEEEEEEEENASSPDQSKLPPHQRARFSSRGRQMYEDSDLDMSEDDVDNPARKEAIQNAPFLLRPPSTARYGAKVRSPSPLASSEDLPESVYRSTQISSPLDTRCSPDDLKTNQSNATSQDQSGDIKSIDAQMGRTSLQPTQGAAEEREENEASSSSSSSSSRGTTYKKDFAFPDTETSSGQGNEQLRPFDKLKQMLQNKRTTTTTTHDHADDSTGALWRLGSRAFASSTSSDTKAVKSQQQTKLQYAPPRKYILQSPVFQVVNANTIKDCYLFLFSDLLLICIPIMDENIISNSRSAGNKSNGSGSGKGKNSSGSGTGRFRPTENSLFQVKNIVELSKVTLYISREDQAAQQHRPSVIMGPDGRPSLPPPRKMHPVLATALRKFERKPEDGIAYLIEKQILADEPLNIANFLFKTPDLNRRQLGYFLADPDNRDIYDAFLDCFRLVALRLDEALRILLMTLRLPSNWELLEYVIERFSKKWHDANQNVVKFHEDMVVKVVVAMLFLNAEVWYDASSERDVFWFARENKERRDRQRLTRRASMIDRKSEHGSIAVEPLHYISSLREKGTTRPTWEEFLKRWKHYDQYGLVPVDFLENMYHSIVQEALETGWDNPTGRRGSPTPEEEHGDGDAEQQDIIITVTPHRFPSRLTKNVPSAPITISIPSPDPGLQIKLRGQDLVCKPNVLDFSKSCVQTFTITGHTLGRTSLTFIKSGAHAGRYVSPTLPRTKSIVVERQFMRYTFQIGFSHADMRAVVKSPTVTSPQTPGAASSELIQESGSDQPVQPVQPPAMVKRKYTFSVENEQEKRKWITSLKALCGHVHWSESGKTTTKPEKIMSNEERVALQVLKEELLADEFKKGTANVTVPRTSSGAAGQTLRSSMISVDTSTAISRDNDPLWVLRSPDKEDVTFLDAKESDKDSNKNRKSYIAPSSATTNVVTKRGHEIVKLVVQNSMVPLMLGFLRGQIERPTQ